MFVLRIGTIVVISGRDTFGTHALQRSVLIWFDLVSAIQSFSNRWFEEISQILALEPVWQFSRSVCRAVPRHNLKLFIVYNVKLIPQLTKVVLFDHSVFLEDDGEIVQRSLPWMWRKVVKMQEGGKWRRS